MSDSMTILFEYLDRLIALYDKGFPLDVKIKEVLVAIHKRMELERLL